jgi:hypothetical protein
MGWRFGLVSESPEFKPSTVPGPPPKKGIKKKNKE